MKKQKVIYYKDELNDDFSKELKVEPRKITGDYKYLFGKNVFKHFFGFILYRLIATPAVFVYMYLFRGLRVKNRKVLKKVKGGYFLYANHTQICADAFSPSIVTFPKRAEILVHPDAVSIPVVRHIVPLMGAMPVPSDVAATRNLLKAMKVMLKHKRVFIVYPEAHIWPYYNGIRNFKDASFYYPIKFGVPAVGYTVTYRQRKIFKNLPPCITITVSNPVMPEEFTDKKALRDRIYNFMVETTIKEKSYEYIKYVKENSEDDDNGSV